MDNKKEGRDLTQGNLLRNMLIVFFPLLLTNLLNSIYNFVDGIWIGRIVGENGISVTTNVYPLLFIITAVGYGLSTATSVLIAQYYGAKDNDKLKRVVKVSVLSTIVFVFIFHLLMALTSNLWLKLLGTPGEVWNATRSYFCIYLIAYFFNFILMNMTESIRAIGNTKMPIVFVTITTILNIVLDPILLKTPLGIDGAAVATLIAILIGFVFAIIYINTKSKLLSWSFKGIPFDMEVLKQFIKISIPILLQEWFIGIVLICEVKVSNETGVEGSASYGIMSKLEQIVWIIGASFKSMVTVFVGQFVGNKQFDDTKKIMIRSLEMAAMPSIIVGIIVYVIPHQLCTIFIDNEVVIASAISFLRIMGIPFICAFFRNIVRGFIGGTGHTKALFISAIAAGIVEVALIYIFKGIGMANLTALGFAIIGYMIVETSINVVYILSNMWKKSIIE